MQRKMTISIDEAVYQGLRRNVEPRKMSKYIENLLRPHVLGASAELESGYRAMAADSSREQEAREWSEGLIGDGKHEAW